MATAGHIQAIQREHPGERLTDPAAMADGLETWLERFGPRMTPAQRALNREKLAAYRLRAAKGILPRLRWGCARLMAAAARRLRP